VFCSQLQTQIMFDTNLEQLSHTREAHFFTRRLPLIELK
jgi:hypothetical protein